MAQKNALIAIVLLFTTLFASAQTENEQRTYARTGIGAAGTASQIRTDGTAFSTRATLSANGTLQTLWMNCEGFLAVYRISHSNVISATGGIVVEWANDTTNLITPLTLTSAYTTPDTVAQTSFTVRAKFLRYRYINGATAQGSFFFQIMLSTAATPTASQTLSASVPGTTFVEINKSAVFGRNAVTNSFESVTTQNGRLQVQVDSNQTRLIQGVNVISTPLPTDAATATAQATGNTRLTNIDTDLGAITDAAVTDPAASASVITALKGLLQKTPALGTTGTAQDISLAANVAQTVAASTTRRGIIVSSNSGTINIGLGYTATATRWTYRIVTSGIAEIPVHFSGLSISLFSTAAATATVTLIN